MNHWTNRVSVCRGCQQNTFKLPNETSCKHWICHYLSIAGHNPFSHNGYQYKPVVFELIGNHIDQINQHIDVNYRFIRTTEK